MKKLEGWGAYALPSPRSLLAPDPGLCGAINLVLFEHALVLRSGCPLVLSTRSLQASQ